MTEYPKVIEHRYHLSIETELFYFDVYPAWHSKYFKSQEMFRAGVALKKGNRQYHIFCDLFPEWDYSDKDAAFEAAKNRLYEIIAEIGKQLIEVKK